MSRDKHTKEKVVDVACELFAKHGYNGVSIRKIAKEAGVNLAAVNYHFQNKAMLYGQIIHKAKEKLTDSIKSMDMEKSALDICMGIYDVYVDNGPQLRHTFAMMISDVSYEIVADSEDQVGPPGEAVITSALRKEFGVELSERAIEFGFGAITAQIVHYALLSGTPVLEQLCQGDPERFSPETLRQNVEHAIRGILSYLGDHHASI